MVCRANMEGRRMVSEVKMAEQLNLYKYRSSLDGKHQGIELRGTAEQVTAEVARLIAEDRDVCEIRVTDNSDFLVLHWMERVGIMHPMELKDSPAFQPRVRRVYKQLMNGILGRTQGTCLCGSTKTKPDDFKNDLSRKEYTLSGLCQKCQDGIWNNE